MSDIQATYQNLLKLLENQKAQLVEEIRSYPPPIPACDAQFNYLLEKRDRLTIELNRLHKFAQNDNLLETSSQDILTFIENSAFINPDKEQYFRHQLQTIQ